MGSHEIVVVLNNKLIPFGQFRGKCIEATGQIVH